MDRGNRLKILRLLNGHTQSEFAQLSKIPQPSIANWEKGKYGPGGEAGIKVASLLGVHPQYLFLGTPPIRSEHVWIPAVPMREQHLLLMQNDIVVVFADFLTENVLNSVIAAELKDGFAFLLGREATDSKHKYAYNCLILAERKLAESFKRALQAADVNGYKDFGDILSMVDRTIETITVNDIYERLLLKGLYCECDIEKLGKELQAARKRIAEKSGGKVPTLPPGLEYIFRNFIEALFPSIKSHVALGLTKFFLRKCEEHGGKPNAKIADTQIVEFRQALDGLGIKELIEKPARNFFTPKNEEYRFFEEYLREKLSDDLTSQERLAFLVIITKGTDFMAWKEKYEQEIKEGKRIPSIGF